MRPESPRPEPHLLGWLAGPFRFNVSAGTAEKDNPARKLKNPKITDPPTMPLSRDQVSKILAACHDYPDRANAVRLRALVLLLRYSSDVMTLLIRAMIAPRRSVNKGNHPTVASALSSIWCVH